MKNSIGKNLAILAAALGVSVSCSLFQDYDNAAGSRNDSGSRDGSWNDGARIPLTNGLYLTIVDFPEGYDWQRDTAHGSGAAVLRVLRDGEEVFSMDVGMKTEMSTDPDMLHFVGGRIYSEFYDGKETIYKCNGKDVLRVADREMLKGLMRFDTHLYALCQSLTGRGLTLRKDWKDVLHDDAGSVHGGLEEYAMGKTGALYEDNGSICFNYTRGKGEPGRGQDWFMVIDGEEHKMDLPSGIAKIYDIRQCGGVIRLIAKGVDGKAPYYFEGSTRYDLTTRDPKAPEVYDYRLNRGGGEIRFSGTYHGPGMFSDMTGYWNEVKMLEMKFFDCKVFRGDIFVFRQYGIVQAIYHGDKTTETNLECRLINPQGVEWTRDGGAYIAMERVNHPHEQLLWHGGVTDTLRFNGYISNVSFVEDY